MLILDHTLLLEVSNYEFGRISVLRGALMNWQRHAQGHNYVLREVKMPLKVNIFY